MMPLEGYQAGGSIDHGKLVLDQPDLFKQAMWRMRPGRVVVKIEQPIRNRSLAQNAYLHAVPFPILAEEFGCSVEDVKYDLMGEKWGWKESPIDRNRMIPVKPSTSSMTVDECKEFIDWLIPWAMQNFNVRIPLPSEEAA
jgi:hypothetical protein